MRRIGDDGKTAFEKLGRKTRSLFCRQNKNLQFVGFTVRSGRLNRFNVHG